MTKEELALEIIRRLKKEYPDAGCTLDYNEAWKLLVSVRLAAQCTDARNGTISFTVTERANIDRADAVSIAQDAVRTGFTGWNLLLHKRLGLSLKYLGFTSWK